MGRIKTLLFTTAALAFCANDNVYHTRNFNTDQYGLQVDRNNYRANEKPDNKILREYKIKGKTIMAYSKKDAIKRLKHSK